MLTRQTIAAITWVLLFIVLITAIAAIAANLGLGGLDPESSFAKTTLKAVLVEIVVALVYVWRSGALRPTTVSASIRFPDGVDPKDVDLDPGDCKYEIRDAKSDVKGSDNLAVVQQWGNWTCKLPYPEEPDYSMILRLKERNGTEWEVRPFYPLSQSVRATKVL